MTNMRGPDRHDTAEFLERMYRLFRQLGSRLPTHDLKPGEKDALGAGIFYGDAEMIDETAWALRHHPDLYPDILALGIHAGDLEEEQEQALWWLALGLYFGALASRAMDNHL